MRLGLHRLAEQEVSDAFWHYETQKPGLGEEFLDDFQRSARSLLTFPRGAPVVRRVDDVEVRKKIFARFPYELFFTFEAEAIFILAVAHQKRRPGYWAERIDSL